MVTRPTPPTVPPAPSRAVPATFSTLADAFLPIFALFQTYLEGGLDYDEDLRDQTLAAAVAGNLADLDLSALAGFVIGVNDAGNALEGVELVPAMEVFQSKQIISDNAVIDFTLVDGVDEHIFQYRGITTADNLGWLRVQISDDSKVTFETIESESRHLDANTDYSLDNMILSLSQDSIPSTVGITGELIISQLSGKYPALRADGVFYRSVDNLPRSFVSNGHALTIEDMTDVRFHMTNSGSNLLESGEIIYTTRTYA